MKDLTENKKAKDKLEKAVYEARKEGFNQGKATGKSDIIAAIQFWAKRPENQNRKFKDFIEMWFEKVRMDFKHMTCRECDDYGEDTLCTGASRVGHTVPDCPICDFHIKRLAGEGKTANKISFED